MSLGCIGAASYAARIVTRPFPGRPARPLGSVNVQSGTWARKLNATTAASLVVPLTDDEGRCASVLGGTIPWVHEVEVWRGNEVVWAGPVLDVLADPAGETATVTAQDLSYWWSYRALAANITHTAVDAATIFADYIAAGMAADDPGIVIETTPTGVLLSRVVAGADRKLVSTEVTEVARAGVDWTTTVRKFWIGGVEVAGSAARLPVRLTDEAFAAAPRTRRSGSGQATETFCRGDGVLGHAGGPDPDTGLLLQVVTDDNGITNQAGVDAAAATTLARRGGPQSYLEGNNVLAASVPIDVATLIPGVLVPVAVSGGGVVPVTGALRLESVDVTFDAEGDSFTVSLQPEGTVDG